MVPPVRYPRLHPGLAVTSREFSARPALVIDHTGACWLYVDGVRVADMNDLTVYDFGQRLTVESGLVFEVLPPAWKPRLVALGFLPS